MNLARAVFHLSGEDQLFFEDAVKLHGVIMSSIDTSYAEELHESSLHPFTQHIEKKRDGTDWVVSFLNDDVICRMWRDALRDLDIVHLDGKENGCFFFTGKEYTEISYDAFLDPESEFSASRGKLFFVSPMAFRQGGRYVFYPDLRLLYQSLVNKYNTAIGAPEDPPEEMLERLCEITEIISYDLHSTKFYVGKTGIPSFTGQITIRLSGSPSERGLAGLLLRFGEYSGAGIKTGLGMGAIRYLPQR